MQKNPPTDVDEELPLQFGDVDFYSLREELGTSHKPCVALPIRHKRKPDLSTSRQTDSTHHSLVTKAKPGTNVSAPAFIPSCDLPKSLLPNRAPANDDIPTFVEKLQQTLRECRLTEDVILENFLHKYCNDTTSVASKSTQTVELSRKCSDPGVYSISSSYCPNCQSIQCTTMGQDPETEAEVHKIETSDKTHQVFLVKIAVRPESSATNREVNTSESKIQNYPDESSVVLKYVPPTKDSGVPTSSPIKLKSFHLTNVNNSSQLDIVDDDRANLSEAGLNDNPGNDKPRSRKALRQARRKKTRRLRHRAAAEARRHTEAQTEGNNSEVEMESPNIAGDVSYAGTNGSHAPHSEIHTYDAHEITDYGLLHSKYSPDEYSSDNRYKIESLQESIEQKKINLLSYANIVKTKGEKLGMHLTSNDDLLAFSDRYLTSSLQIEMTSAFHSAMFKSQNLNRTYAGMKKGPNENTEFRFESDLEDQMKFEEELRKSQELEAQEFLLNKEIEDLVSSYERDVDNDVDSETDQGSSVTPFRIHEECSDYISSMPWGEQKDEIHRLESIMSSDPNDSIFQHQFGSVEQMQELMAKHPNRAIELHNKLSSSRIFESEEKNAARRRKAEEKRQKILEEKAAKMRDLQQKVKEVKHARQQLAMERKTHLDMKLKKAEENRNQHLSSIRKKAHNEEEKLKEIAFINELEAQNRRLDSVALRMEQEERLQNIIEERQRKNDEKAAKEAAVGERKRVLEAKRQEKLERMQEKRRKKEEIIGRRQQEKENERLEIAREKAREREFRLQARQAAQIAITEELQKKIKEKQENSARRHEENIEHIRQKALETGLPRTNQDEETKTHSAD